ncbi:hypothetical protein [Entomomonas asaccharolytica]|uniref:Restriction endonuclease n=1 Tax=Entomomonas asaccharolytica TaxID=2785331 RepID=A0A974RY76_9GAMM|nr:hypothetical protein [Entomomonas asaccharolytica]QQP86902.1 hypothetical protein JHT90_06570 [Entomomonas asaccharolytica]
MSNQACIEAYDKHKNLKLAADEVGIKWQQLYTILIKEGVKVTGDKARYGSDSDKLAAEGERIFKELVPIAKDLNAEQFQSKIDFDVLGYSVDVKTSTLKKSNCRSESKRWAFSLKKQEYFADFFVCIAIKDNKLHKIYLIPCELVRYYQSISMSENGSKWDDYLVKPEDLLDFFKSLPTKETVH